MHFDITDTAKTVPVVYKGILPDSSRRAKASSRRASSKGTASFHATEVLAKHDENYMPPAAADAVNKARARRDGRARCANLEAMTPEATP